MKMRLIPTLLLRSVFALALSFSMIAPALITATTCVGPRLKLSHICGFVIDVRGVTIGNAKVKVLKDGNEVSVFETKEDGEFTFPKFAAGSYEIEVVRAGFRTVRYAIVVKRPSATCKRKLRIQPAVTVECSQIWIVKK
jgi:Carboxypeptidase regulatory-like domain